MSLEDDVDWASQLYEAAKQALDEQRKPLPEAFGTKPSNSYVGAEISWEGEAWAVCSGQQNPSSARLLDTTIAWKMKLGAQHGVALLRPPVGKSKHGPADGQFLTPFQTAVWQGFGIVFFQEHGPPTAAGRSQAALPLHAAFLDDVVSKVRAALDSSAFPEDFIHESRDAEAVVRLAIHRILRGMGYKRAGASFRSMWRRSCTDGTWENRNRECPRIALEVKYEEDVAAPLCQLIDYLGAHDAVLQVRLVNAKTRSLLTRQPQAARDAAKAAMRTLPLRLVEVDV